LRLNPERINILFSTTGGEINEGLEFYKFARDIDFPIHIYNIGAVRSTGTIMFLAFDNRHFLNDASFLLHSVRLKDPVKKNARKQGLAKEFTTRMIEIYKERTSLPEKYYDIMQNSEDDIQISDPDEIINFSIASPSNEKFGKPMIEISCS
jgi:ATP-dependent protease ClpP protease subunit